jgi:hypothetical protein
VPLPAPLQSKFKKKKRYETTVILIDDSAAVLDNRKKLTKWTDDFTDARNWLIRELDALHGEQYFAGIFDHMQKRPVLKEKGQGRSDALRLFDYWFNRWTTVRRDSAFGLLQDRSMAAHPRSQRRRDDLCAGGLRKRASLIASVMRHSITKSC